MFFRPSVVGRLNRKNWKHHFAFRRPFSPSTTHSKVESCVASKWLLSVLSGGLLCCFWWLIDYDWTSTKLKGFSLLVLLSWGHLRWCLVQLTAACFYKNNQDIASLYKSQLVPSLSSILVCFLSRRHFLSSFASHLGFILPEFISWSSYFRSHYVMQLKSYLFTNRG